MDFSPNIERLRPSATIAVSTLAKKLTAQGKDVIDLSAGEPDFPTPSWISDAAVAGIRAGRTRYTPAPGMPELRAAVAESLEARSSAGWTVDPSQIVVTSGAKQALFNACFALFGPGDEVLVATPYWTSYPQIVALTRAEPVCVRGPEERGFRLEPADLDEAATERTRGLILCSPSNPTGAVYPRDALARVASWARDRGIPIISDEIYRWIYFGGPGDAGGGDAEGAGGTHGPGSAGRAEGVQAPGLLDLEPQSVGPHVVIDGVSKSFAMTGWRIGYALTSPELATAMGAIQSHTTSNAATPSQLAALEALSRRERASEEIAQMVRAFRRRRDLVVRRIRERLPHLPFVEPDGAFYLFLRVDEEYGDGVADSETWCSRVLERTGVALVPGAAFGDDRYVRLSYATSDELLEEAIRRLAEERGTEGGPA